MIIYKCHKEVFYMTKREKISEERRNLIQEFISSNELKNAVDVEERKKIYSKTHFKKC